MGLASGARLGPYEILALLGTGGMGEVYRARDLRLNRDVALKVLVAKQSVQPGFHERLQREAMAAAAVAHPHICTLYDICQEGQLSFLVMEYLEGETLSARIFRGPLELTEAIVTGVQIAEALAAAHAARLIHHDLKPGNVMLTRTGAKLLDFGLARARTDTLLQQDSGATATDFAGIGMVTGTLQYMSPERLEGKAGDHRADIFAFGAVLYEMITGSPAFPGRSRAEIIAQILKGNPLPLRLGRRRATHMLASLVRTCLAKEPEDRWQSAADLATTLKVIGDTPPPRRAHSRRFGRTSHGMRSLVVLPLQNATEDPNEQYLADGMTECLINSMSVIGKLRVISRSSAMKYRDSPKPLRQIAGELGVDGLIRGSVRRSDSGVNVSVALLEPSSPDPLWSEVYDRALTDLLRVQGEIAETIAAEIYLRLSVTARRRFRSHRPTSPEINEAYLRGRYYWNRDTPEALHRSFQYLSVAVQGDPDYAAAHAALADWYLSAGNNGLIPVPEGLAKAKGAASRARELDPGLAEAYACLGRVAVHECDVHRALAEFETSLRLNPNLVEPVIWSARALSVLSMLDAAIKRVELAKQLDPISPRPYLSASAVYYIAGNYERAIEESKRALEFEPGLPTAFYFMGVSQLHLGLTVEALASLETSVRVGHGHAAAYGGRAFALVRMGRTADARDLLNEMKDRATRAEVSPYYFAEVYLALGEVDKAISYLRRSYELRIPDMVGIGVDPLLESLHDHPDFQEIVRNLALVPRPKLDR
jgi:serine/threonine protein kinase/Flp pilus assembly protein TadD